ncbi:EscF/YscF/HrpA family type III secretion system needle major subunit [Chitinasiproducens palmae]|uniref:Type III secretion system major needle protein, YscF/MxiH/PrgI family n=1 Tax=Chitinasiproducens palmae TaxID=1770053 RepID=A0A1H2PIW7_9BURK|nr:EscF/YscF/HrpA family type III secretion system needle major subunit [Chitinasiproducens palmae]SDV46263.1 type III secretion system major needle protein, YscF/MxiH/PrgI family [Chitinasiproducens palmae]
MPEETVLPTITLTGIEVIDRSQAFEVGATQLKAKLEAAQAAIEGDASSAFKLAQYQSALSAYTLFRNAQSATVKAHRDIAATTLSNLR